MGESRDARRCATALRASDPLAEFRLRPLSGAPGTCALLIGLLAAQALAALGATGAAAGPLADQVAATLSWAAFRPSHLGADALGAAAPATALTYVFVHHYTLHFALNLGAIRLFGPDADAFFPVWLVIGAFAAAAIGGALGHAGWAWAASDWSRYAWLADAPLTGASGAACGLLGLDMGRRAALMGLVPRGARVVGPFGFLLVTGGAFAVADLAIAAAVPMVSAGAHLGGFATGALVGLVWTRMRLRGATPAAA